MDTNTIIILLLLIVLLSYFYYIKSECYINPPPRGAYNMTANQLNNINNRNRSY